jgi:hypothetical protein
VADLPGLIQGSGRRTGSGQAQKKGCSEMLQPFEPVF